MLCLSVWLKAGWSSAAIFTWTGAASSDWFVPNNWAPVGVPSSSDTINVTNGTINLTSSVTINGAFNWSGGSLSGDSLTIESGGVLNIAGNVILQNVLTNAGTVTMTGTANLIVYDNTNTFLGGVYNLTSGLWDLQTNANIGCACYGFEFFNNAGVFRKSLGSGSSSVGVNFTNSGTVTNLNGALNFTGGGPLTGIYATAAGATIGFAAGSFTMGIPPLITGLGVCEFTGTTLTLTQDVPANLVLAGGSLVLGPAFQNGGGITNLTLSGGTLIGSNTVTGTFNWNGGSLAGPMTVESAAVLNIGGNVILQNVLTNAGTVTMIGTANLTLYNNTNTYLGGVYNLTNGLWDLQTNANISCACYGFEFFNNAGVFRKSLGSSSSSVGVSFSNSGTVTNFIGTLNFGGGGTLTGTYGTAAGATINFAAGSFTMGVPPVIVGSGVCEFTGTTLTLTRDVPANLVLAGGTLVVGPAFQNGGGITNLTLSGGTLIGSNTVTGTFNWNGGSLGGPLTVESGAVLNINGNVILQNVLTNAGTVTMTGTANLTLYNNTNTYLGGVYNLTNGLWDLQTNANISCACYGFEFFNNAGVFRKSLGSGSSSVGVNFTNSGTVTNLVGTLSFTGGGPLTGTYGTAAGAIINFAAGSFTLGVPPLITGSGVCEFFGTTLTLTQDVPANLVLAGGTLVVGPAFQNGGGITNLTLSGGTLIGSNTVTGTFNWNGGSLGGPLTVESGAVLNINGNVILQNVLTNAGTVTMTGTANLTLYNNTNNYLGGVYNLTNGLWDLQTNANISCACYGFEFFNNAGVFRKSLGSGSSSVAVSFSNSGTVTNLVGTLSFTGGGPLTGTYDTAAGAIIYFAAGTFTMGVPPVIAGSGVCEFIGTTLTLTRDVPANLVLAGGTLVVGPAFQNGGGITNLTLSGGTLIGSNTVTGTFDWNGGSLGGPLTVESGAVLNIKGNVTLENVLTNAGTVTMTGTANLTLYNNTNTYLGGVYNLASGLWDLQTNANIGCACYGFEFFNNVGMFRKSLGSGLSAIAVSFTNSGTVNGLVGTLGFYSDFTTVGGTLAFGVSGLSSFGQINFSGNAGLGGTVSVAWLGGFMPAIGNSFALLDYGSHSGTFANINLPSGSVGLGNYGATVFSLLITSIGPPTNAPVLTIERINSNAVAVSWPTAAGNFGLQTRTDLSSGTWSSVTSGITTVGPNYVLTYTLNGGTAFFRLKSQ